MPGGGATRPPDLRSHQLLRGAPASPSPQAYPGGEPRLRRRAASPGDRGARDRARGPLVGRTPMNILLLSMPDSFEHMPSIVIRMPNGALASLAGNIDPHHRVAVADLILVQKRVRETIERLVREMNPDIVGLSVMTFQRETAKKIIALVRNLQPKARIVVGGYDPSLAPEAYMDHSSAVDFIVRGEGEITLRELLRAIENNTGYDRIAGLSYRCGDRFHHNPDRRVNSLESGDIKLPNRKARVLSGYTMLGRQVDVIETSRGCTFDCSFCSIIEMRGRNFYTY